MSLAPPAHSPIAAGYRLDRYELICPIAEGGMASVWIARQTGKHGFQKLVAIKTILPKYAAEPRFQRMFVDEARIASRIEHANVTEILDVGEQHDVTYLVMEYVDGDALSKIHRAAKKKDAKVPLGILLRIMADVCGGLHAAHELKDEEGALLGVVHRDVSPQNVLVTTHGVAKLIDFGIAKARDRLGDDTNADTLKGKVQYMPPEQALGRPIDRRADVWAVGAVLYHLISGKPPYEGTNEIATLFLVTSGRSPVPLPPGVPAPVRDVVKQALAGAPENRFATAAELQQALEDAIVASNLVTSTAAVAAFLAEMVGDRAEKRKEAIALGLKAADEREKVAAVMRSNADSTHTGSDTGQRVVTLLTQADTLTRPELVTSPTGQTLGSTAMAVPTLHRGRRRTVAFAAVVAALVLAAVAVVVFGARLSGSGKTTTAAAPPPPAATLTTTSPAPSIPPPPPPASAATASAVPSTTAAHSASAAAVSPAVSPKTPPRWVPPTAPATTAATKPAPTTRARENYGF